MRNGIKKFVSIGAVAWMCFACLGIAKEGYSMEEVVTSEKADDPEEIIEEEKINGEIIKEQSAEENEIELPVRQFTYTFGRKSIWDTEILKYNLNRDIIGIPALQVCFPEDEEKEKKINQLILTRCSEVLPTDRKWIEEAQMEVIYRSEKYFCFRYLENSFLPEDYDVTKLYFLIDLEKEELIDYPATGNEDSNNLKFTGDLYLEMEKYEDKTVEEQNVLQGETAYDVYEETVSYADVAFSCVQVQGMQNAEIQSRVNEALKEPMIALIENDDNAAKYIGDVKIYIAYKTPKWLSIVYTFEISTFSEMWDGYSDVGVTVNMETGERCMLDELFNMDDGLLEFLCVNTTWDEDRWMKTLKGCILTEEELLAYNHGSLEYGIRNYDGLKLNSFYLHSGKLILTSSQSFADMEIPLPEISRYLSVDPWYE